MRNSALRPSTRRFVSDNDADPKNAEYWVGRGERLGGALQAIAGLWATLRAAVAGSTSMDSRGGKAFRS